jgi:hypothetical protein
VDCCSGKKTELKTGIGLVLGGMATLLAQARSALVQASSPSAQVKAAEVQVGDRNWNWEKKSYVRLQG